jgi:NitT/TauT family transport system substrate-binding protein
MRKQYAHRLSLILLLLAALAVFPAAAQDEAPAEIRQMRFFLPFIPNIQFAAVYTGIEKGHYAAQGLELSLEYGEETVAVDLLAAGDLTFSLVSGEQVILARAGARPIVYVYEWFQRYPVGIVVPDSTEGVTSIADLAGRRVGIPGRFGASYSGLIAALAAHDMQESDINLEPIGFVAPDVVCAGGVEASVIYVNNEPLQIQQRADAGQCGDITAVSVLYFADYANMVSNGVVTNEMTLNDDPDLVRAFVTAFDAGLRDSINNPAEAYLLSLAHVETLPINAELRAALEQAAEQQAAFLATEPERAEIQASHEALLEELSERFAPELLIQFRVLLETNKLLGTDTLGLSRDEDWALTAEIVELMELTPGPVDLDGAYTNDFVPGLHSEAEE